jgi:hypothetical protein
LPRERAVNGKTYQYHRIVKRAFTGYKPVSQGDFTVLIAEPEKALADYCSMAARGVRKPLDAERIRIERLNKHRVIGYARLFKNKTVISLLEKIFTSKL